MDGAQMQDLLSCLGMEQLWAPLGAEEGTLLLRQKPAQLLLFTRLASLTLARKTADAELARRVLDNAIQLWRLLADEASFSTAEGSSHVDDLRAWHLAQQLSSGVRLLLASALAVPTNAEACRDLIDTAHHADILLLALSTIDTPEKALGLLGAHVGEDAWRNAEKTTQTPGTSQPSPLDPALNPPSPRHLENQRLTWSRKSFTSGWLSQPSLRRFLSTHVKTINLKFVELCEL